MKPMRAVGTLLLAACAIGCGPAPESGPPDRAPASGGSAARGASAGPADVALRRRTAPLSVRDREDWRAVLKWPASCEEAFQASHAGEDGGLAFNDLAPGLSVVEVLCAAGAYQPSHVYLRHDERGSSRDVTLLEFPVLQSPDGVSVERSTETELWGVSQIAIGKRELSMLSLSRQTGDCGIWTRYAIGTERPALLAAASRLPCPAQPGPPADPADGGAPRGWREVSLTK